MQYSLYDGITYGIESMDKNGISADVKPGEDERWYKFDVKDRAVINPIFELAEKERKMQPFSSKSNIYQNI